MEERKDAARKRAHPKARRVSVQPWIEEPSPPWRERLRQPSHCRDAPQRSAIERNGRTRDQSTASRQPSRKSSSCSRVTERLQLLLLHHPGLQA